MIDDTTTLVLHTMKSPVQDYYNVGTSEMGCFRILTLFEMMSLSDFGHLKPHEREFYEKSYTIKNPKKLIEKYLEAYDKVYERAQRYNDLRSRNVRQLNHYELSVRVSCTIPRNQKFDQGKWSEVLLSLGLVRNHVLSYLRELYIYQEQIKQMTVKSQEKYLEPHRERINEMIIKIRDEFKKPFAI